MKKIKVFQNIVNIKMIKWSCYTIWTKILYNIYVSNRKLL